MGHEELIGMWKDMMWCVHIWWSAKTNCVNRRSHKSQFFNWIYFKKMRSCNVLALASEMIDSVNCLTCDNLKTFHQRKLSCERKQVTMRTDAYWRKRRKKLKVKNGQFCNESYKHLFFKIVEDYDWTRGTWNHRLTSWNIYSIPKILENFPSLNLQGFSRCLTFRSPRSQQFIAKMKQDFWATHVDFMLIFGTVQLYKRAYIKQQRANEWMNGLTIDRLS